MEQIKLVVIDNDIHYLNNLMNYISTEYKEIISAVSFSNKKLFLDYIENQEGADIFLISTDFYYDIHKENYSNRAVLLSENNKTEDKSIYKYQSIDKICKQIIEIYNKTKEDSENIEDSKVISFFSPIGGIGTSTISIATAIKLAKANNQVLYLNLERIQSNGIFMTESRCKYNFSDLLINIKEGGEEFEDLLSESIIRYEDLTLYYFNPIDSILDIEDISLDDIKDLLSNICNSKRFNYIIIDLPSVLDSKYYYIFEEAEQNIVIIGQDPISSYKIDTMLRQLDNISKFKFVFNMYDDLREKKISKLISVNLLPIISTINLDYGIRGEIDINKLLNIDNSFSDGILMITNNLS